jgi:hypothetical protein
MPIFQRVSSFVPQSVWLSADGVANTTVTLANTSLTFPVVAGGRYWFRAFVSFSCIAPATGARIVPNGPAFTRLRYMHRMTNGAAVQVVGYGLAAWQLPATASGTSPTGGGECEIQGIVTPSAAGNVVIQIASEVATSPVTPLAGSHLEWRRVG